MWHSLSHAAVAASAACPQHRCVFVNMQETAHLKKKNSYTMETQHGLDPAQWPSCILVAAAHCSHQSLGLLLAALIVQRVESCRQLDVRVEKKEEKHEEECHLHNNPVPLTA